jgi:hypothetical protein
MKNTVEAYIQEQLGDTSDLAPVRREDRREDPAQQEEPAYRDPEPHLEEPEYVEEEPEEEPEPEPEYYGDPEVDRQREQEAKPKQEHRSRADQRIREAISERQKAIEIANRLAAENEQLRQMASQSSEAVNLFREDSIERRRDLAKKKYFEARENGDLSLEADASFELAEIAAELKEVQKQKIETEYWNKKAQEDRQNAERMQQQAYAQPQVPTHDVEAWFNKNTWALPNHPDYDADAAEELGIYADGLENRYRAAGMQHLIGSQQYLAEINRFVAKARVTPNSQTQRRQIPMKTSRTPVSQARGNSGRPATRGKPGDSLSEAQKDMARRQGVSYETYEKWVKEDRAEHADMGRGQY